MSKSKIIILLGVANIIIPFLGLPSNWKTGLFIVLGLYLIYLGYAIREKNKENASIEINTENYSESYPARKD
ncbi:hypothetical protein A2645_01960 [Candidatus Nomurabacteria bacterium RIFCSPHIGHO2_01_FULL_39_9]|uniref:Uncharacterized protein n=1 Tax=Candidatus Nomurabacteria bacterium RIFCSPHIGHO2_01_FULL_39_9 TaxID=1801735 RepID=A0A1F6UX64_9BACT|nr:MAG: hypothetical protein A2645_01960 [Candidatus Nomurabacteria bacterium RIFCSPHIGHO2_01_FULL_39_9]